MKKLCLLFRRFCRIYQTFFTDSISLSSVEVHSPSLPVSSPHFLIFGVNMASLAPIIAPYFSSQNDFPHYRIMRSSPNVVWFNSITSLKHSNVSFRLHQDLFSPLNLLFVSPLFHLFIRCLFQLPSLFKVFSVYFYFSIPALSLPVYMFFPFIFLWNFLVVFWPSVFLLPFQL